MRAYVVVGAESSGNRLLAACLVRAGCHGAASTNQPPLPDGESPAVIVRSLPHGGAWPDLRMLRNTLEARGYAVTFLGTVRDAGAVVASQVKRGHAPDAATARRNIGEAYRRMTEVPWRAVTYEGLTLDHAATLARLLPEIGLPPITEGPLVIDGKVRAVFNGNAAHG